MARLVFLYQNLKTWVFFTTQIVLVWVWFFITLKFIFCVLDLFLLKSRVFDYFLCQKNRDDIFKNENLCYIFPET